MQGCAEGPVSVSWKDCDEKESVIIHKIIAIVLIVLGLTGLALGRLGETVWAPETSRTASVALSDPGAAVVLDPGLLYVGGHEGEATITGASDVSVITAGPEDITAYLGDAKYTRVTGVPDWSTLSTEVVNPEGPATLDSPTASDLWRSVDTQPSPATIDIAAFSQEETRTNPQPYRPILLVTDGASPGAEQVSITWPVDAKNAWVPYAYAAGATLAILGLLLLVVSLGSSRRRESVPASSPALAAPFDASAAPAGASVAPADASVAPVSAPEAPVAASGPGSDPAVPAAAPGSHRAERIAPDPEQPLAPVAESSELPTAEQPTERLARVDEGLDGDAPMDENPAAALENDADRIVEDPSTSAQEDNR